MCNLILSISIRVIAIHNGTAIIFKSLRVIWLLWCVVILVVTGVGLGRDHIFVLRYGKLELEIHPQLVRWEDLTFNLDSWVEVTIFGEVDESLTLRIGGFHPEDWWNCTRSDVFSSHQGKSDHASIESVVDYRSNQLWVAEPPIDNPDDHDACRVGAGLIKANWKMIHWWLWEGLIGISIYLWIKH